MTRFLMSIEDAVDLIQRASEHPVGGEALIARMRSATVADIAAAVIEEFADGKPRVDVTGRRAGEREHELLMSREESSYARATKEGWILGRERVDGVVPQEYSSLDAPRYTVAELRKLFRENRPQI